MNKIAYYDLRWEALKGRLKPVIGREDELSRLSRVVKRALQNNCLLVGPSGVGKTALVHGWAKMALDAADDKEKFVIVQLDAESFQGLNSTATVPINLYKEAVNSLPAGVVFIDNFGQLTYNKPVALNYLIQLFKPLLESSKTQFIFSMEQKEYKWIVEQQPSFANFFEVLQVKTQGPEDQVAILAQASVALSKDSKVVVDETILQTIISLTGRFSSLGQMPASAIKILDESIALSQVKKNEAVSEEDIYQVVADKIGIPLSQLKVTDTEMLKRLDAELNASIIGQEEPIEKISTIIKRAKLGLKNPNRPLGSFLVLGPSGVGKTETAKILAEKVFGKQESFIRIDMSEFGEAHTVARLIGAPAGYVGYEAGGGLTNSVKQDPYSLVLLDEIEKANPKIFDIFLQILDDGRLTSGQGETIDFTQTIVMATSNLGVAEIIKGFQSGEDIGSEEFLQAYVMPALGVAFRLEFLNRFDSIVIFNPLTKHNLLEIAQLEIKKIELRVTKHNIRFSIDPQVLMSKINTLADPRFGARPVKRFVEATCETLISKKLLSEQ